MSKAVLISIRPEWCEKIVSGQKTIEVRKTCPKIATPFKCYIYCTKAEPLMNRYVSERIREFHEYGWIGDHQNVFRDGDALYQANGRVIGEFICDRVISAPCGYYGRLLPTRLTGITPIEMLNFADEKTIYGWHISNLVIYDKPRELSKFYKKAPCQYWHEKAVSILDHCHYDYPCENILNFDTCKGKKLSRPPQSWCYVEDIP